MASVGYSRLRDDARTTTMMNRSPPNLSEEPTSPERVSTDSDGPWATTLSDYVKRTFRPHWVWVCLLLVTCLAAIPRLDNLGASSLWNDEATTSELAITALRNGLPIVPPYSLLSNIGNYEPLYPIIEAQAFRFLGIDPFAARLPSAVFGILMVPSAFLVGRKLRGDLVGLALALMVAFSTEYIAWSRQARQYTLFSLLLLAIGLLCIMWVRKEIEKKSLVVGLVIALLVLLALCAPGLFFLYIPGIVCGVLAYVAIKNEKRLVRFFALDVLSSPSGTGQGPAAGGRILRRALFGAIVLTMLFLAFFPTVADGLVDHLAGVITGSPQFPLVWVPVYGAYLLAYYPWILILAVLGGVTTVLRLRAVETGLLAFTGVTFLSLSSLLSLTINVAGGAEVYERYLTPLLVFLFYFAAVGLVEAATAFARTSKWLWRFRGRNEAPVQVAFVAAVCVTLILPGVAFPSPLNLNPTPAFSTSGSEIPWNPFSPYPQYASALYDTPEPDFALACGYIAAHRQPGDVLMAVYPEAPSFYLGPIQYRLWQNPRPGSDVVLPDGQVVYALYYLTGPASPVSTVSEFESILTNYSGWNIGYPGEQLAWGPNLTLAVEFLTDLVPAASDSTLSVYHWTKLNDSGMMEAILQHRPDLQRAFGTNYTALVDWGAVSGVTVDGLRPVLLPLESYLVNHSSPSVKPLAVLLDVFNARPDLQRAYPEVLDSNFTALLLWAKAVVSGQISDPAYSILEPYAYYYLAAG